ncbi:hypothetical protein Btru_043283 [Bulinus truncatus]|nr:hypothetical protein Btru_043283 [Bulinus truncatus]
MRNWATSLLLVALASGALGGAYNSFYDYMEHEYFGDRRRGSWDDYRYRPKPTTAKPKKDCGISPEVQAKLQSLTDTVTALAKQTMILQELLEEKTRSDGQSGIKQVRHDTEGTKNYYGSSHIDTGVGGVHDHSDYIRLLGMGEVSAVINGVEFRTRHNDYRLTQKSGNRTFLTMKDIPYPSVPESVTRLAKLEDQIEEMKKYFEAWATQNTSLRDYRPYFKANLCYMETMWINDPDTVLTEPYYSDRHHFDARSWDDLMSKNRYMTYTGTKDNFENLGFMPRKIMSVDPTTGIPTIGQLFYRILCHPIDHDIPFKYLKQREDLHWRYPRNLTLKEVKEKTRAARFSLNSDDDDDMFTTYTELDKIMQTIPGMNNDPNQTCSEGYGGTFTTVEDQSKTLNACFYHRYQRWPQEGAMGSDLAHRGFSDQYMFVAINHQNRVVPMSMEDCKKEVCTKYSARVSYAIPMEIVYTTPLNTWNPHNITYNNDPSVTTAGGMDGNSEESAYNGVDFKHYYLTPSAFFSGPPLDPDDADTPREVVKVRNNQGQVVNVTASGITFMLRPIEKLGNMRLRYPIAPLHCEGSTVSKEVNAMWAVQQEFRPYP